ncbi:MAG: hypothetical protein ABI488_08165 [Polyangiaceae bacterium]
MAIDVNFRMAYVGTVSIVDEHGEALVTRRYAAPACDDAATLVAKMTADVRAAVRRDPNLAVGAVQDGAPARHALRSEKGRHRHLHRRTQSSAHPRPR